MSDQEPRRDDESSYLREVLNMVRDDIKLLKGENEKIKKEVDTHSNYFKITIAVFVILLGGGGILTWAVTAYQEKVNAAFNNKEREVFVDFQNKASDTLAQATKSMRSFINVVPHESVSANCTIVGDQTHCYAECLSKEVLVGGLCKILPGNTGSGTIMNFGPDYPANWKKHFSCVWKAGPTSTPPTLVQAVAFCIQLN